MARPNRRWTALVFLLGIACSACGGGDSIADVGAGAGACLLSNDELGETLVNLRVDGSAQAKADGKSLCTYTGDHDGDAVEVTIAVFTDTKAGEALLEVTRMAGESLSPGAAAGPRAGIMHIDGRYINVTYKEDRERSFLFEVVQIMEAVRGQARRANVQRDSSRLSPGDEGDSYDGTRASPYERRSSVRRRTSEVASQSRCRTPASTCRASGWAFSISSLTSELTTVARSASKTPGDRAAVRERAHPWLTRGLDVPTERRPVSRVVQRGHFLAGLPRRPGQPAVHHAGLHLRGGKRRGRSIPTPRRTGQRSERARGRSPQHPTGMIDGPGT